MKALLLPSVPQDATESGESVRERLIDLITSRRARIGVVGLGYVGLPLALEFANDGFRTIGFEIDPDKVRKLNEGRSNGAGSKGSGVVEQLAIKRFKATTDFGDLALCDCIIICVPTPLNSANEPDLACIRSASKQVKQHLRHGQLVVLESTTYPGCTDEVLLREFEQTELALDENFLVAFSPERIDLGNKHYTTDTPRIVGGCSEDSAEAAKALYEVMAPVHVVSSTRVAETAKLLENTFRAINIGLVNEMALLCRKMGIDVWEVIQAAATKPYGFMPFYPGPGIGGHCIPLDPAYLSWKGRQFGFESGLISAAQQVNAGMPRHVVQLIADGLNSVGKPLQGARVLLVGVAYKTDVNDVRESPAIEVIQHLRSRQADVSYHDPFVAEIDSRELERNLQRAHYNGHAHPVVEPLASVELSEEALREADAVVILTAHTPVDYRHIAKHARLIVDTRNAIGKDLRLNSKAHIIRL